MYNNVANKTDFRKMSVSEQLLEIFKYGVFSVQPNNILDNFIKVKSKKIIVTEGSKQKIYSKT